MKKLIHNPWATWAIRSFLIGLLVLWVVLFVTGWISTRPEEGPVIEGRSLYAWGDDLPAFPSSRDPDDRATAVLRRHSAEVLPTALDWAHRNERPSEAVYFGTVDLFLGKRSSLYDSGVPAHVYRELAAQVLGALGAVDPRILPALEAIRDNPDGRDWPEEVARRSLERFGDASSQHR